MNELLHANAPKVRFRLPRLEPARFQDGGPSCGAFGVHAFFLESRIAL